MIPRFYNKKIKVGFLILTFSLIIFYILNVNIINNEISQELLESHALYQSKQSSFNPRYSTNEVFNYINNEETPIASKLGDGIVFHWDDWVDLSSGDKILNKYKKNNPNGECDEFLKKYASVNGYYMESYNKKIYRGMSNLYCLKEIPSKIIAVSDDNFVEIPVINKLRIGLNNQTIHKQPTKHDLINQISKFDSKPNENFQIFKFRHLQKQIDVKAEDFVFNPNLEIFKLQKKLNDDSITNDELNYLKFLEYADSIVDSADRFFKYPWIYSDVVKGRSHHLAYPFFKRFIGDRERQSVIHHMVRAWFKFAEANNFASWVNYGSLLGWAYNGVNMPWDTDIDIQLPIAHLDRLAREFNQSLILENPRYGNSKYLLEVSPTYIRQGNGRNFIDARFIDINSGLYIDISALSHSNFNPPKEFYNDLPWDQQVDHSKAMSIHCKNWNWHSLEEILPIRHTWFEGASIYIPHNVSRILTRKYGKSSFTTKSHFANHNYQKDINMWVPDEICSKSPSLNNRFQNLNQTKLTLEGACNNPILQDEFQIIAECAHRHLKTNIDVDHFTDYDILKLNDLPLFRKDSWDYFNDLNLGLVNTDRWYVRDDVL